MTSLCAPTPVRTLYETRVVASSSTSFTTSITSIPPQLTTVSSASCLSSIVIVNSTICLLSTDVPFVSTVHGAQVNTVQIPIVLDVASTQVVPTSTQFQSCSDSSLLSSTPKQPSSVDHSPNQSFITSSVLVLSTPAPEISVYTSSTTLANGQVSVNYRTSVYSQSPTPVYVLTTSLVTDPPSVGGQGPTSLGAIVGGVLGGVAGLILIVALFLFIRRRQRRVEATFEKTWGYDDLREQALQRSKGRTKFSIDVEPKPYQYGVIGHANSLSPGFGQFSSKTRLLDSSPNTPSSTDFFAVTPATSSHTWGQPPTRRSSISVDGPVSPGSSAEQTMATTSHHSDGRTHMRLGSETGHEPPRISMSFANWGDDARTSPVSVQWPRNLVVVNQHEEEQ